MTRGSLWQVNIALLYIGTFQLAIKTCPIPAPSVGKEYKDDGYATSVPFSHPVGKVESPRLFILDSGVGLRTQKRKIKRVYCPKSNKTEENYMNRKITYGAKPHFTANHRGMFSRGNYDCYFLLQYSKGQPVAVSQNNDPDLPIWKAEYGCSCLVFGSYNEAMAYCKGRFFDLSGKPLADEEA